MKKALIFLWGLPQNALGLIIWVVLKLLGRITSVDKMEPTSIFWIKGEKWGVSLGLFIFLTEDYRPYADFTIKHEYGHFIQSVILGPLYLILVGIPSATFNLISRFNSDFRRRYYFRYPENWANKLVGLETKQI